MRKEYVLGFFFNYDLSKVVLIRKRRPEWQRGKLNGIGGKVEPTDVSFVAAMTREFKEEAGVEHHSWRHFLTLEFDDANIHCYYGHGGEIGETYTASDEIIRIVDVMELTYRRDTDPHVPWMVQMARSAFFHEEPIYTLKEA